MSYPVPVLSDLAWVKLPQCGAASYGKLNFCLIFISMGVEKKKKKITSRTSKQSKCPSPSKVLWQFGIMRLQFATAMTVKDCSCKLHHQFGLLFPQ